MSSRAFHPPDHFLRFVKYRQGPTPLPRKPVDFRPKPPYPHIPAKRILREKPVTVCIACICDYGKAIVAVCDSKLSTGYASSDRATLKAVRISNNWGFMYAAADVSPLVPIRQRLRHELKIRSNELSEVTDAFQGVYHEQILTKAKDLSQVPQETLLGVELLGFGYDKELKPHIFTATDPQGRTDYHDIVGFHAVGSGAQAASSILYFYGQNPKVHLPLTIYHASAAKFMAESASDVGKHTSVIVFMPSGEAVLFNDAHLESLRDMWDREGKPRTPANAQDEVSKLYTSAQTLTTLVNDILKEEGSPPQWSEDQD